MKDWTWYGMKTLKTFNETIFTFTGQIEIFLVFSALFGGIEIGVKIWNESVLNWLVYLGSRLGEHYSFVMSLLYMSNGGRRDEGWGMTTCY